MANGTNTYIQLGASYVAPQLDNTVQYNEHYQQLVLAYQKLSAEKQKLEELMAMIAHKFRGALISLDYNVKHQNKKQFS